MTLPAVFGRRSVYSPSVGCLGGLATVADREVVSDHSASGNAILSLALTPQMGAMDVTTAIPRSYFAATFSLVLFGITRGQTAPALFAPFSNHGTGAQ